MPRKVLFFRAKQELQLESMRVFKSWSRLEVSINEWWREKNVSGFIESKRKNPVVLAEDALDAFRYSMGKRLIDQSALNVFGNAMKDRKFSLLGARVPDETKFPWHSDWRLNYAWQPTYFRNYDFYSKKKELPYDVKFPWELSRLGFVLPIMQCAVIENKMDFIEICYGILRDWEHSNPLAYSVNWFPMEASIRVINLTFILDMLLSMEKIHDGFIKTLLTLITKHGEFIWRTFEYTDIRGNHYSANITALLLCGLVLKGFYPPAGRWVIFAQDAVPDEIQKQFHEDGVNFEKSIPYHRLVTELFLLALIATEKAGYSLKISVKNRLHSACRYTAAYTRPDGLTPIVGDNDDSRIFNFDPVPLLDHRPLLGVGAAVFEDPILKSAAGSIPAALLWLNGLKGIEVWGNLSEAPQEESQYFQNAGIVIVRKGKNYFWMDIGEVGLCGRGGHGHNDLFSFELMLDGVPLVVDPGCFVYTGDPRARDLFRSTSYHNGLCIDKEEIAPMSDMWTIGNDALPRGIEVNHVNGSAVITARHEGYRRLSDPLFHTREIRFNAEQGVVDCIDHLDTRGSHRSERYLHFDPSVKVVLEYPADSRAVLSCKGRQWVVHWAKATCARVDMGSISPGYGVRIEAPVLVLTDNIAGKSDLSFRIEPFEEPLSG